MKPVLYLDVDGVLLDLNPKLKDGSVKVSDLVTPWVPSKSAPEFLQWSKEHLDVRWLTSWCTRGKMIQDQITLLANIFNFPEKFFSEIEGLPWRRLKSCGVAWLDHLVMNRPFVWVEDGLLQEELHLLDEYALLDSYFYTDVFEDSEALEKTFVKIKEWYNDL